MFCQDHPRTSRTRNVFPAATCRRCPSCSGTHRPDLANVSGPRDGLKELQYLLLNLILPSGQHLLSLIPPSGQPLVITPHSVAPRAVFHGEHQYTTARPQPHCSALARSTTGSPLSLTTATRCALLGRGSIHSPKTQGSVPCLPFPVCRVTPRHLICSTHGVLASNRAAVRGRSYYRS